MKPVIATFFFITALASQAVADVAGSVRSIETELQLCLAQPENETTMGMNTCLHNALHAADELQNTEYMKLLDLIENAIVRDRLQKSQEAWVLYRTAQGSVEAAAMLGGSGEMTLILSAEYEITKRRIFEVEDLRSSLIDPFGSTKSK